MGEQFDYKNLDRNREASLAAETSFDAVAETLLKAEYRFAKTMPQTPHWYTMGKTWTRDMVPFENVVAYLRVHGYESTYRGAYRQYFDLNGMQYWSMGWPTEETILINRARPALNMHPATYDRIAEIYDGLYTDDAFRKEEKQVFAPIQNKGISLLDIGCGTGLALDYVDAERYVGIDPSFHMLAQFESKWGQSPKEELVWSGLESFWTAERFDHVICLFGVLNYLTEDQVKRIPSFCKPGGRYHVMVYKPGYIPYTRAKGDNLPLYELSPDVLPGTVEEVGEGYYLIRGIKE